MKTIKIGDRIIGEGHPVFIIAEAGVNHNGDIKIAKKLVDVASAANADAIKFQTFKTDELVTPYTPSADYQIKNIGKKQTQFEMLKQLELDYKDFIKLKEYCDKKNIIFLSTSHTFDAIDFLEDLVPAYKFGSGDITNIPALEYAASKHKPMIISTGMATIKEIKTAVDTIRRQKNNKIVCLHCTTNYPCPPNEVNLRSMIFIRNKLNCLVGYSDHTLGILVPLLAVSMGACVIEKHFTLRKDLIGPDHKASLEPHELNELIKKIREVEIILGEFEKKPTDSEKKLKKIVRKSLVAEQNIRRGSILKREMISIKRPEGGIPPRFIDRVIGRRAKRNIRKNEFIKFSDIE